MGSRVTREGESVVEIFFDAGETGGDNGSMARPERNDCICDGIVGFGDVWLKLSIRAASGGDMRVDWKSK